MNVASRNLCCRAFSLSVFLVLVIALALWGGAKYYWKKKKSHHHMETRSSGRSLCWLWIYWNMLPSTPPVMADGCPSWAWLCWRFLPIKRFFFPFLLSLSAFSEGVIWLLGIFLCYCRDLTLQYKVPWGDGCWDFSLHK